MDSVMAFVHSLQGVEAHALLLGSGFGLPVNEDLLLLGAAALALKDFLLPELVLLVLGLWLYSRRRSKSARPGR